MEFKIIGCSKIDTSRRINISKLLGEKPYPKQVSLTINLEFEMLEVRLDSDESIKCKVDDKGRITLPAWIHNEFKLSHGDVECFRFVEYDGKKFLSPVTGTIL